MYYLYKIVAKSSIKKAKAKQITKMKKSKRISTAKPISIALEKVLKYLKTKNKNSKTKKTPNAQNKKMHKNALLNKKRIIKQKK